MQEEKKGGEEQFFDEVFEENVGGDNSEDAQSEELDKAEGNEQKVDEDRQEDQQNSEESPAKEELVEEKEEPKEEESAKDDDQEDKFLELEAELHNYKKRFKSNQVFAHKQANKLKIVSGKIKEYVDNGLITKEEAEALDEIINLDLDKLPDTVEIASTKEDSLIDKYYAVWEKNIPTLQEIMDIDPEHVDAFEHLVKISTPQELEEITLEFSQYEKSPIKLTKRMVELGKEHYEDVYKPLNDHGGYKGIQIAHKQEVVKYKKEIDKLNKELLKLKEESEYLVNSKNSYNIPSSSVSAEKQEKRKPRDKWDDLVDDMYD